MEDFTSEQKDKITEILDETWSRFIDIDDAFSKIEDIIYEIIANAKQSSE